MQAAKMTYEFDIDSVLDKFRAVLDEAGLIPGEIVPDGRLRRCGTTTHPKSTNGWQVLHSNPFAGAYGDWATGISDTWGMDGQTISSADRERLREEIHRQRQKREAAHLLKIQLAATKAILTLRAKAGNPKNDINEIIRQVQDLEDSLPEIPIPPRLFVDDITPEGLVEFMGQQGGRAAILEAEGGIFELISGLYTNDKANLNVWLKAWSCEKISVDRKSKDTIHIDKPALSMVLLPQPDVLRVIGNKDGFRGRGLLGGFLYCLPQSRLGQRLIETPPIPARSLSAYESKLLEIVESPWATDENGNETHHVIRLSQDAYKRWVTFADSVEAELGDGGELFNMTGWAGKLPGQAIRHKPFVTPG